ncbi:hypothetical protein LAV72_22605 [Lysinibacillus xylanilyticus]|uniref:hypothetical protein n=1 Tax=Lysinibacillus xylanilyticus TaxID=582475 RepID=UPI002B24F708|nr:hypothetical protein [Lysinibacillus xylanilyticus]MEB2302400.1 hypothetical protein [Lysinibacillus xylanilyticus]
MIIPCLIPSLALRKRRLGELITLLLQHTMKDIDEQFYDLIPNSEENTHTRMT